MKNHLETEHRGLAGRTINYDKRGRGFGVGHISGGTEKGERLVTLTKLTRGQWGQQVRSLLLLRVSPEDHHPDRPYSLRESNRV